MLNALLFIGFMVATHPAATITPRQMPIEAALACTPSADGAHMCSTDEPVKVERR